MEIPKVLICVLCATIIQTSNVPSNKIKVKITPAENEDSMSPQSFKSVDTFYVRRKSIPLQVSKADTENHLQPISTLSPKSLVKSSPNSSKTSLTNSWDSIPDCDYFRLPPSVLTQEDAIEALKVALTHLWQSGEGSIEAVTSLLAKFHKNQTKRKFLTSSHKYLGDEGLNHALSKRMNIQEFIDHQKLILATTGYYFDINGALRVRDEQTADYFKFILSFFASRHSSNCKHAEEEQINNEKKGTYQLYVVSLSQVSKILALLLNPCTNKQVRSS